MFNDRFIAGLVLRVPVKDFLNWSVFGIWTRFWRFVF